MVTSPASAITEHMQRQRHEPPGRAGEAEQAPKASTFPAASDSSRQARRPASVLCSPLRWANWASTYSISPTACAGIVHRFPACLAGIEMRLEGLRIGQRNRLVLVRFHVPGERLTVEYSCLRHGLPPLGLLGLIGPIGFIGASLSPTLRDDSASRFRRSSAVRNPPPPRVFSSARTSPPKHPSAAN